MSKKINSSKYDTKEWSVLKSFMLFTDYLLSTQFGEYHEYGRNDNVYIIAQNIKYVLHDGGALQISRNWLSWDVVLGS